MAIADEFPDAIFKLCSFHLTKAFREKLKSIYGGTFQKNKKVAVVWRFLRAVPYMNWSSSSRLIDAFLSLIEQTLPNDKRRSILIDYLKNTYFDRNGQFRHFSYLQWDYFNDIISDDFNTTTNCSESINSAYNRHCKSGFRSANIIASNIFDFKYNMLAKRGLIRRYGETKMKKVKPKTLTRQVEISTTCRSISHMNTDDLITDLSEFLTCLGNANTSEFVLDRISNDFFVFE